MFRGNCHPQILKELRKFYTKPQFLPEDCEMPAKDYVFMGFDAGATMHVSKCFFYRFKTFLTWIKPI